MMDNKGAGPCVWIGANPEAALLCKSVPWECIADGQGREDRLAFPLSALQECAPRLAGGGVTMACLLHLGARI